MYSLIIISFDNISDVAINNLLFAIYQLNGEQYNRCDVIIIGYNIKPVNLKQLYQSKFITTIFIIDDCSLEKIISENIVKQITSVIQNAKYSHVVMTQDYFSVELLPQIAGLLDVGVINGINKIISNDTFERFMYTGNVLVTVKTLDKIKLLIIDDLCCDNDHQFYTANQNYESNDDCIDLDDLNKIINIPYDKTQISHNKKFISKDINKQNTIDLKTAKIIVSGGASLGSKDNFANYIYKLADKLSAGVGATKAAVDLEYINNDSQIGQTGVSVAPKLYLAFGVSGAMQHIAGIKNAKLIVAINTDKTAPIFYYANYGIHADLFEVIPYLVANL